jgi:hypothetical protein
MHPQVNVVTIGAADVGRAKHFYEALGCPVDKSFGAKFVSFDLGDGSPTLGLYTRPGLAKDAGVPVDGAGFCGMTLASVAGSPADVDATLARAEHGGARLPAPARTTDRGYEGAFDDPDGVVWNVIATASLTSRKA